MRTYGGLVYGRISSKNQSQQYRDIMGVALYRSKTKGRQSAIEWLQHNRPWLKDYFRGMELPASGTILDNLIKNQ